MTNPEPTGAELSIELIELDDQFELVEEHLLTYLRPIVYSS